MSARTSVLAGLFATACAALPALASSQGASAPATIPTPAPGGTPVTFGSPERIGTPPAPDAPPDASGVPTGAPDGPHARTASEKSDVFVVGDYLIQPKVYDEFSHGNQSTNADYALRAGAEFSFGSIPFMFEAEERRYSYRHEAGFITNNNGNGSTFEPGFDVRSIDSDARIGVKLLEPRVYLVAGYLVRSNDVPNDGTVRGPGFGLEKLPDFHVPVGLYGSALFYPNVVGAAFSNPDGTPNPATLRYRVLQMQLGVIIAPGSGPVFLDIGVLGDKSYARDGSPSSASRLAPHVGIGFSFR